MNNAIILLHGTSSTGKTSTARQLQLIFPTPLIYFSLDCWIRQCLSPPYYEPATRLEDIKQDEKVKQGTHFLLPHTKENPLEWPMVGSGPVADDAINVMYQAIIDYYNKGYWVIIDHVFIKPLWREQFLTMTENCRRMLVKMTADEASLAAREQQRGDRMQNVYCALLHSIHQNISYDLTIDTSALTPNQAADELLDFAKSHFFR